MSKMRVLMFVLAFGSAIAAALLARGMVGQKPEAVVAAAPEIKSTEVLVAAKDIEVGEKLVAGTLLWKKWPQDNVIDSMITRDEKADAEQAFAEARAVQPMFEGETVMEKKLVFPGNAGFMSAVLPKGMRALSVAISSRSSAGGFILPNDRVDVILTRKIQVQGAAATTLVKSETVISNVRVLAINQTFKQAKEGEEVAMKEGETATLEMNEEQAEIIARTESEGELSLSLRSIAESDGKAMEIGPQLAEKYRNGSKVRNNDTLFVRYGIETYATNN